MTWTLFNLQLFLTQLLQDLCSFGGTSSKDLTTLVSQLWLQGTFYNLTPDETDFSTLILYIILHPNEHCSPLRSKQPPTWGLFPLALTGLSLSL